MKFRWFRRHPAPKIEYQKTVSEYHQEIQDIYHKMRQWRHDYRNHLETMSSLADGQQWELLSRYIKELRQDFSMLVAHVSTGNPLVDAIVSSKMVSARKQGIDITATIVLPYTIPLSEKDLCALLGNLLDNAIEACSKADNVSPYIRMEMSFTGGMLHIMMVNSSNGQYNIQKGQLKSQKPGDHGFGLLYVQELVQKYGGYCSLKPDIDTFGVRIVIPLES